MRKGTAPNIVILALFVLTVLIAAGAYFIFKSNSSSPSPETQKLPPQEDRVVIKETPTAQFDTSLWATYTDDKYKFSFKHPSQLQTEIKIQPAIGRQILFNESAGNTKISALVYVTALGSKIGRDFDNLYEANDNSPVDINDETIGSQKLTKVTNRVLGGYQAFDYTTNSGSKVGTYIKIGQYVLVLEAKETDRALLDTVLSTFNQEPTL